MLGVWTIVLCCVVLIEMLVKAIDGFLNIINFKFTYLY